MRNLSIAILSVCCIVCSLWSSAQGAQNKQVPINEPDNNKPKLFADLPDRLDFNPKTLSNLFDAKVGQWVNLSINPQFSFSGQVVSKADESNSTSVVVSSVNRVGAKLIFTRITEDNDIKYIGRIISMKHGDTYEISQDNNQYYFKKKGYYDLIAE